MASSRSLGTLTIDLITKIGGFEQGFDKAARVADSRSRQIQRSMNTLKTGIVSAFAAIGGSAAIGAIIRATTESEKALTQLNTVLKSTGNAVGLSSEQLQQFASDLQKVTTFGDDAVIAMESVLLTFTNVRGEQFKAATESVLDLSTALGQDLKSAALLVGKALNDPVLGATALSRSGIQLSKDQKELIKSFVELGDVASAQNIILKELNTQFGGQARAAADTFGGSILQLKEAFGDLLEGRSGLGDAKESIQELTRLLQDPETVQAAGALTSALIQGFSKAAEKIATTVNVYGFLFDEVKAKFFGAQADDIVRMQDELENLQYLLNDPKGQLDRLKFFGKGGLVEWWSDDELKAEIARLQGLINEGFGKLNPLSAGGDAGSGSGAATAAPPSEEFTKELERLQEMIAMHGKVGEAAKLSYQIQIGALDELSRAEQQQLIALADQVDGLKANEESVKRLRDEYTELFSTLADNAVSDLDPLAALSELTGGIDESLSVPLEIRQAENYDEMLNSLGIYVEDVQLSYEQMYATIDEQRQRNLISEQQAADARTAISKMETQDRLSAVQELTYGLSSLMSSGSRRAFEIGKAAAVANATVTAIKVITDAYNTGNWITGVAQAASAAAILYSNIEQIKNVQFQGYQSGGYTGNGGIGDVAGVVHGREYVMDAASTARLGVGNLDALREGGMPFGGNVYVTNNAGAEIKAEFTTAGDVEVIVNRAIAQKTPKLVASQLALPNSVVSKSLSRNTKTTRNR